MTEIFNKSSQKIKRRVLRQTVSKAEAAMWALLRNRKLGGYKFRRQFSIDRFVVDFYCPLLNLAIEIDGKYHAHVIAYDRVRQQTLESIGIQFLRFTDEEIVQHPQKILKIIQTSCIKKEKTLAPPLLRKERGKLNRDSLFSLG